MKEPKYMTHSELCAAALKCIKTGNAELLSEVQKHLEEYLDSTTDPICPHLVKQTPEPPKDDRYLIYKGFCGNAPLFWTKGDAGYSCIIERAKIFTEKEVDEIVSRDADLQVVKYSDIESWIISVVWFN